MSDPKYFARTFDVQEPTDASRDIGYRAALVSLKVESSRSEKGLVAVAEGTSESNSRRNGG
jgi:hypothetical protein